MAKRGGSDILGTSKRGRKKARKDTRDTSMLETSARERCTLESINHEGRTPESIAAATVDAAVEESGYILETSEWVPRVRAEDMPGLLVNPASDSSSDFEAEGSSTKRRKGRGPNIGKNYDPPRGRRWVVQMNTRGQAVGKAAGILGKKLGLYARMGNFFPIDAISWKKVNSGSKDDLWKLVEDQYDFRPIYKAKKFVFASLNLKWKAWKNKLKTGHYDTHTKDEDRFEDRDFRIDPAQWVNLVKYWSSHKGITASNQNKRNRAKKKLHHRTGTKSLARLEHEIYVKKEMSSRTDLYVAGYSGKPEVLKDDFTIQTLARLRELNESQSSSSSIDLTYEPVTTVIGKEKPGRVRGLGFGCSQRDVRPAGRYEAKVIQQLVEENQQLKVANNMLNSVNCGLKKDVDTLQVQMRKVLEKMQLNADNN